MQIEIERRFLVTPEVLTHCRAGVHIRQGYLHTDGRNTLRVRRAGERGFLTWKGKKQGSSRAEFEREISPETADFLLSLISPDRCLEKRRYGIEHAGLMWEVDVFDGALAGLILAEVELQREDQPVTLPPGSRAR
ncbi:CYTH domain-containing protein [Methylobacterium durans]|uniref:CYTH domain-containing protein n=1 Tax=Methylobacterium durans TaxID=2202825 RepID=UPI001F45FC52|nr:CYTH domain-containing protein [Methylobacterium durans]